MPASIFPLRMYQFITFALVVGLAGTCICRAEYFDDAWFAEQAYWLMRTGWVRSELFRGLNGWEHQIYVFHKLFIYTEALIFSVLGVSVGSSKVIGVLFGLAGLVLVWRYPAPGAPPEQRWLAVVLYLGCGTLIRYLCLNRPETMYMTLGFASFFALQRGQYQWTGILWAGALAGMAALTHLNGLAYMLAGGLFVLLTRGLIPAIVFGLIGSLVLSLYLADAVVNQALHTLVTQFQHDPATKQGLNVVDKLLVMTKYHEQFFHSENEAGLSVLALLSLLVFRRHLRPHRPLLLYLLLLVGSFWLITKGSTDIYFLLFLPWLATLVAELTATYLPRQPHWQQRAARWLMAGYLAIAGLRIGTVLAENSRTPDMQTHNARLATFMPRRHTRVIAPIEFFFGEMEHYQIRGLTYYRLLSDRGPSLSLHQFFQLAERSGVSYIVGDHGRNATYPIPANANARIGLYRRVYQDDWNSVYAREVK